MPRSENMDVGGGGGGESKFEDTDAAVLVDKPYRCTSTGSLELLRTENIPPTTFDFESAYRKPKEKFTLAETVKESASKRWMKCSVKRTLCANFPTISTLKHYKVREYLPNDVVAGLTAGITMIPQGMAFAQLSTLPPIVGLYICLFASLTYFVVGTCHQLSWGCVAVLSILMGNLLDSYEDSVKASLPDQSHNYTNLAPLTPVPPVNVSGPTLTEIFNLTPATQTFDHSSMGAVSIQKKIEVAGAVTLISGIILALLGKLGLGRLTTFMSDSLITSFTVGVSFHVVTSQIRAALDLDVPRQSGIFKLIKLWVVMLKNIEHTKPASVVISLTCIVILYSVKRFINEKYKSKLRVPVPIELFVVIVATLITAYSGLSDRYSVSILREVPIGVPAPRIPDLSLGKDYIAEGLIIIIVSFTQNVAMAKLMALKHNYRINPNQEMFSCGMVSVVCSLFSGFISGPSVSRSLVQDGAGGKTQVASLFAAGLVLLVIMVIGPYFYHLPNCVLAAIIIVNLRSMFFKLTTVPALWRQSHVDAIVWITTCAATVILGTDIGLLVGIVVGILLVLIQSQVDTVDVVSEIVVGDDSVWRPEENYFCGKVVRGVKVVRINSALYFANAEIMTEQVFKKTGVNPIKMKKARTIDVKVRDDKEEDGQGHYAETETLNHLNETDKRKVIENDQIVESPKLLLEDKSSVNLIESVLPDGCSSGEEAEKPVKSLILDLSSVPFVDVMGVQALEFLIAKYEAVGIEVYFASAEKKCLNTLQRTGFMVKHKKLVFISVEAAVQCALDQQCEV